MGLSRRVTVHCGTSFSNERHMRRVGSPKPRKVKLNKTRRELQEAQRKQHERMASMYMSSPPVLSTTSGKRTLALETLRILWMPWEALGQSGIESTEGVLGCPQGKVTLRPSPQGASGHLRAASEHFRLALGCPRLSQASFKMP